MPNVHQPASSLLQADRTTNFFIVSLYSQANKKNPSSFI